MSEEKFDYNKTKIIIKLIFSLTPSLAFWIPVHSLLKALFPFVNYVFSIIIIDELAGDKTYQLLLMYATSAIVVNCIVLILMNICKRMQDIYMYRLELDFERNISLKFMNLDYSVQESNYFQEIKVSIEQLKMRTGGIARILRVLGEIVQNILSLILAFVSFIGIFRMQSKEVKVSFWTGPWALTLLLFISFGLLLIASRQQLNANEKVMELNTQINQANGSGFMFMQLISDYHFGKDIRIYHLTDFLCSSFEKLWNSPIGLKLMKKMGHTKALIPCLTAGMDTLVACLAYILAMFKAINGEITVGAVMLYAGSIQIFIQSISILIYSLGELIGSCDQMKPYIDLLNISGLENQGKEPLPDENIGLSAYMIEFVNVSFKYPGADKWALRNIDMTFTSGECLSIVGMNGSGKTTLIKLLCRLYEPTEGLIRLNGKNIQNISIEEYRKIFGVVFQDFQLFSFTLGENVASEQYYMDWKIYDSLEKSGIRSWAENLPQKLNTILYNDYSDKGVEISGGEAQKIAIARAIYRDKPFLILDEPTAALDPEAEYFIYRRLYALKKESVIYISHRLSSCRFCTKIIVLHEGRIVQIGRHDELVKNNTGKYYELWQAQAQFYQ